MNNMHSFFSGFSHSPVPRRAAVLLVVLAWSSLAFCGDIHEAAKAGDLEKVKALLKDNPDLVFSKDTNGWTPLHFAADEGHKEVVAFLLVNKANINAKNNYEFTPLHLASMHGRMDVAELLLAWISTLTNSPNAGDGIPWCFFCPAPPLRSWLPL